MKTFKKPTVFISSCIEHDYCRYDGQTISDLFVRRLMEFVNVISVCPELSVGMGVPRESIRLVQRKTEDLKLLSRIHGYDYTEKMNEFSLEYVSGLKQKNVDGFILKSKSPTCGIKNVKSYYDIGKANVVNAKNNGFFGGEILKWFPNAPVETESRLSNYKIRNRFCTEIFTLAEFSSMRSNQRIKDLVEFHSNNKYLFMTYNQNTLRELGNIVANHSRLTEEEVFILYETTLRKLLSKEPTQKKRINVLDHIYGYFKNFVNDEEKAYYFEIQNQYLNKQVSYSTLLSILLGWSIRFKQDYLTKQTIFMPYPIELIMVIDSGKNL
ncbi:DUF523 and DUF1722 domain-containing protein [Mycoplasmatota bacterium WC30]